ncbi:TPR-like protein [Xylaria telfairii]|nr:TPR-like protein [Xylaria telfairii]
MAMLDTVHEGLPQPMSDYNNYCLGSIGGFNIAIASLPSGEIGSHSASVVAIRLLATFTNVKIGLMVGIGGGVPSRTNDIRLGDVVVSIPTNGFGGVVQHDMGKQVKDGGWIRTGALNGPPSVLRTTISKLISLHQIRGNKIEFYLSQMMERHPDLPVQFTRQETYQDTLYEPEPEDSDSFQGWIKVERPHRKSPKSVEIHYGLIASGNQVMKSGRLRDSTSARLGGVLCFEMEAAGLMNELPCVVIRGICDYADAHKNKEWQEYAAAVAAAYAKELVTALPITVLESAKTQPQPVLLPMHFDDLIAVQSRVRDTGPHWIIPFSRNKHFVGREQELSTLRQWSFSEEISPNMAIYGLGGVGKTQIALEFAYCTRDERPACSIFWVPATDYETFTQAYRQIGDALNIPGINAAGADIMQLVKDALMDDNREIPWLMIIDNADDINMIFRQSMDEEIVAPALSEYIPFSSKGSVLLTTRNRKVAIKQAANNIICVEIMGPGDANKLLARSLVRQEILSDTKATCELLGLLGLLPLAIIQAAAYINENDITIEEYLSLYNDSEIEVMKVLSEDFEVHGRYRTVKNSISATWLVSLSQLVRTSPVATDYLSFMACMCNQNILHSLLPPASSKKQSLEAVGALKAYSLIKKREGSNSFDIHPLVHLATRNWMRSEKRMQGWTEIAVSRLVGLLPEDGNQNRATWFEYLPHAMYLLATVVATEVSLPVVVLAEKLGRCLYLNGQYKEALKAYETALKLRICASGQENRDTLRNMFGIAEALNHLGRYKEAETQHEKILELRRKVLGPKDPEVGRSMNYLGQAMYDGGRYVEAEKMHREALQLQYEVLSPEHPNVLTSIGYLAQTIGRQGKYEEAEMMHRRLLETRLRVLGEDYPGTLATMSCLGVAQGDLGDHAAAEQTHRRVLHLRIKVLGSRHPHTLITKRWLADALLHQKKHAEASSLNREVLELQTELLGVKHPNTILALTNLGDILFSQGQTDRAETVYRRALELLVEVHGPDHVETQNVAAILARVSVGRQVF